MRPSSSSGFSIVILINHPKREEFPDEAPANVTDVAQSSDSDRTVWVAGFIHQSRLVGQRRVDFTHFSRQWRVELAGSFHALQGTKLLCGTDNVTDTCSLVCRKGRSGLQTLTHLFKSLADFREPAVHHIPQRLLRRSHCQLQLTQHIYFVYYQTNQARKLY